MKSSAAALLSAALLTACGASEGETEDKAASGGKADDAEDGGGLLPNCDEVDDDDLACLQHGVSDWEPPRVLNDGSWDRETRQFMSHADQGTRVLPLSWLLALEAPGGLPFFDGDPFLEDERVRKYGLLPDHDPTGNPFQLPVGFSINGEMALSEKDGTVVEEAFFGYTCTACHTGSMEFDGVEYRIDGGAGLQSFNDWNKSLVLSVAETFGRDVPIIEVSFIDDKLDRFIERAQAIQDTLYGEHQSREDMEKQISRFSLFNKVIPTLLQQGPLSPTDHGPGRVDALGRGSNTIWTDYLRDYDGVDGFDAEANLGLIDGMVGLPAIYDAPKFDWVQYGHSIRQPLGRNLAEAIAVLSPTDPGTLETTVNLDGLLDIENHVRELEGPAYPEDVFGAIDAELAAEGEKLFNDLEGNADVACARCHTPRADFEPGEEMLIRAVPLGVIGTDAKTLVNFATREITLPRPVQETLGFDNPRVAAGLALLRLVDLVGRQLFRDADWGDYDDVTSTCADSAKWSDGEDCEATLGRVNLFRVDIERGLPESLNPITFPPPSGIDEADPRCDDADDKEACLLELGWLAYRARPLNGMWPTAPFLHNNSVPNLCLLLGDPADRPEEFWVGSTEFDPECLGYRFDKRSEMPDHDTDAEKFEIEDSGNGNGGHVFSDDYSGTPADGVIGRALTDREIRALVEYVKTLEPIEGGL